jgi:chitin disaccharide deacetylase
MKLARSITLAGLLSATLSLMAAPVDEAQSQPSTTSTQPRLIVRIDDVGFCHGVNMAAERILKEGACTCASVIVNTPWLDEAVGILKQHPEVSVGVHLTLNSEWREYRWGPVLPYSEVPSLVDQDGRFFPSRQTLFANHPKTEEVEKELRAQIELARRKGLPISYLDYHMGAAMSTPELQRVVEKLAAEFKLGISQYFGETYAPTVYRFEPDQKLAAALEIVEQMTEPKLYLFVVHPGTNTPEMAAMTDLNPTGVRPMAAHRQAEADALCNPAFKSAIKRRGLQLIGYRELCSRGLEHMKRPWTADPYGGSNPPTTEPTQSRP